MELLTINHFNTASPQEEPVTDAKINDVQPTPIIAQIYENTTVMQKAKQELFSEYYKEAEAVLQNMTLEEKVGQLFLVRFPDSGVIEEIKHDHPGGYILFGKDFAHETKSSILAKLKECQKASKIPLIFSVSAIRSR